MQRIAPGCFVGLVDGGPGAFESSCCRRIPWGRVGRACLSVLAALHQQSVTPTLDKYSDAGTGQWMHLNCCLLPSPGC